LKTQRRSTSLLVGCCYELATLLLQANKTTLGRPSGMSGWRGDGGVELAANELHLWKRNLINNDPKLTRDAFYAM
jgi:hypothetical protein